MTDHAVRRIAHGEPIHPTVPRPIGDIRRDEPDLDIIQGTCHDRPDTRLLHVVGQRFTGVYAPFSVVVAHHASDAEILARLARIHCDPSPDASIPPYDLAVFEGNRCVGLVRNANGIGTPPIPLLFGQDGEPGRVLVTPVIVKPG